MSFSNFYDSFLNFFRRQNSFDSISSKKSFLDSLISVVDKYVFPSSFALGVFFGYSDFDNKEYFIFSVPIVFSYIYAYYGKFESILHTNLEFKKISFEGFSYSTDLFDFDNSDLDLKELKFHHLNFLKDSGLKFDVFKGTKRPVLTYYVNFITTSTFYGQIALYSSSLTAILGYKFGEFLNRL